jgi:hypothetical protein
VSPAREPLAAAVARGRRFLRYARPELARNLRWAARNAARFELAHTIGRTLRRAWEWSDPESVERRARQSDVDARIRARLAAARARRAEEGPAEYVGWLEVRPVLRGILLLDHPQQPSLDEWLADELGADDISGDRVRVHLTAGLLEHDEPHPEGTAGQ